MPQGTGPGEGLLNVLTARNLTKKIGAKTIVDDVSFELSAGEVYGFLGPNGAGKTTTIRMLVGLINPTAGHVEICGFDLQRDFERAARCFGCIVENPDLYRFMTGRENLEHFGRMLGIRDDRSIEAAAELVALGRRLDDRVRTYSLGMRQRLGIAQALLGEPKLLILDEPANGLDPAGIREMRELLRSLAEERGISVFVSSHLLAEIELMCDRVAIIHRGKLLRTGSVAELISHHQEMELRVGDIERAAATIAALGYRVAIDDGTLIVHTSEANAPQITASLVGAGIPLFSLAPRVQTLEEMFLEATGGESVV
jgi:ABC-2 type transport system ATP-binding protein